MCMPSVDKPDIADIPQDPRIADEQIALATRIAEDTKSKRMSAFRDSIATGSRGLLTRPTTTASLAGGGNG